MIGDIFANYEAFYSMVLSTTIMSNAQTAEYNRDACAIINFIGEAYNLDEDLVAECKNLILKELVRLGKTTDQQVLYSRRRSDEQFTDIDSLLDIKGDVLATIQNIGSGEDSSVSWGWFDYSHYKTYQPEIRFAKIKFAGASGNLIATRQTGLLYAIGIGTDVNYDKAILRLKQCVMWGDIPAMHFLGKVYELCGNLKRAAIIRELTEISEQYLYEGCTVLPEEYKDKHSDEAVSLYTYVSSIMQDVISAYNKKNIDFSFIEAITSEKLDYYDRMRYIDEYEKKEWKSVNNSSAKPTQKIGFYR